MTVSLRRATAAVVRRSGGTTCSGASSLLFEQLLIVGVITGSVYSLVGLGFTLVLGVGKIANFAHGSFVAVGLYLALFASETLGLNVYEAFIPGVILFAIVGVGVAELFEWRGRKVGEIGELLIGLALLLVIGGLLEVLFTDNSRTITGPVLGHIRIAGLSISGAQIVAVAFTLATSLGLCCSCASHAGAGRCGRWPTMARRPGCTAFGSPSPGALR